MSAILEQPEVKTSIRFGDTCWVFLTPNGVKHLENITEHVNPKPYLVKGTQNLYEFKFGELVTFFLGIKGMIFNLVFVGGEIHFSKPE